MLKIQTRWHNLSKTWKKSLKAKNVAFYGLPTNKYFKDLE